MTHNLFRIALAAVLGGGVVVAGQGAGAPAGAQDPAAQQPPVTFRAEVNYVEVDARVIDAQGNFVTGLQQGDFQILEDGQPQKITVFSLVNIPVERAERPLFASKPIEPDVQTNTTINNGRLYLIVLDDLHTHPLRSAQVRASARQFVERYIGANDTAAVVYTSGRADAGQEFTGNPRLLAASIDKFIGRKVRSALLGRLEQEQLTRGLRQPGERIDDPDAAERGFQARNTLDALKNLSEFLGGVRGRRKALVFFSEGIDYDITDVFNNRDATTIIDSTREAIAAATRANVSIFGIDVRGLGAGSDDAIQIQSIPDDPTLGLNPSGLNDETRLGQDSLRVLANETGGFAAVNTNDIAGAFRRLVDENSSYYVLGYYPENDRRDGRFRRIDVRVNKPGLTVRARRGYVAPRGRAARVDLPAPTGASTELREAMNSPIPLSGLPLAATATVFKGPDGQGTAVISALVGGRDLPLTETGGTFKNELEIAFVAADQKGKLFTGDRNTIQLNFKPDTLARVRAGGFRVISSIDLPPGRYQLRVGAREANSRRSGSVLYDIEVPNFAKEPLSLSGIALSSMSSSMAPTARPKDPLAKLLPAPLTTYREFGQNDELAIFTEVYETPSKTPHKVEIALTLKAEGGQTAFQTREERDSTELGGSAGGYGFSARIPLGDIAPGLYVLRVEAQSRVGDRPTVARETIVRVLPAPRTPPPQGAAERPAPPSGPVAMTTINSDQMSGIDRPQQSVVRTDAEWQALWKQHAPGRPAPAVDFAKNMVVAVFLGSRSSGGFQVQITGVRTDGADLVVEWTERRPGRDQVDAAVMTAPAHIVAVPRRDGNVRFEKVPPPQGPAA
jgi:VWFA-related protein